jgi:leucyl/phenylalanyl-tRNA--protein transferase
MDNMNTLLEPFWLDNKKITFPPTNIAMTEPNGLLAVGGGVTTQWLLEAYSKGIFPWYNHKEPILWWTPNPRSVLLLKNLKISKSLAKTIKQKKFTITFDTKFSEVINNCATINRPEQEGTWIIKEMLNAYNKLHQQDHAHCVEVWQENELVGGLYGVAIGKVFFGESMFSKVSNSSKVALVALAEHLKKWGFRIIDTQIESPHLNSLGASLINREDFEEILKKDIKQHFPPKKWQYIKN